MASPAPPAAPRSITPLGITVLALLVEDDMHPYEMLRLLEQRRRDRIVSVTKGSVYHTVARLESQGYIAEVGVDREGNRPERTSYSVRPLGREILPAWVAEELPRIDRPAAFRVALAEAHNVPLARVTELLTVRGEALREQLAAQGVQLGLLGGHRAVELEHAFEGGGLLGAALERHLAVHELVPVDVHGLAGVGADQDELLVD